MFWEYEREEEVSLEPSRSGMKESMFAEGKLSSGLCRMWDL